MAVPIDSKTYGEIYEKGRLSQPYTTDPAVRTDPSYFQKFHEWVYGQYCSNRMLVCPGGISRWGRSFSELRLYARGKQPREKYTPRLDKIIKQKDVNGRITESSIMNISWDNAQFFPRILRAMYGKLGDAKFTPEVQAVDNGSASEKRMKFFRDAAATDPAMKALFSESGYVPEDLTPGIMQMDRTDVDVLRELGGYKTAVEILMKDAVENTLSASDYDLIEEQMREDLIEIGVMATHVETMPSGIQKCHYLDPAGLIVPVSKYKDHRDVNYVAVIEQVNIADFRRHAHGLGEKEIYEIAKKYASWGPNSGLAAQMGNFSDFEWRRTYMEKNGQQAYDNFTICVMTLYHIAGDAEARMIGYDDAGAMTLSDVPGPSQGEQVLSSVIQRVYRSKWVIGTRHVYDYGVCDDVVREGTFGNMEARLPILVWKMDGPSLVEACIAHIDDIQLAVLKKRVMLTNLPPGPRMQFDMALVQDVVTLGGVQMSMMDLMGVYGGRGWLFYNSTPEWAEQGQSGANRNPIQPIASGVLEDYQLFKGEIADGLDFLRSITGLNEVSDGSANPQDMLIGVMKGLEAASNNSMKPFYSAMHSIYRRTCWMIAKRYQSAALRGTINIDRLPVDADAIRIAQLTPNMALYDFDIVPKLLPTDEQVQIMMNVLMQALMNGQITHENMFVVQNMLRKKDIAKAQYFFSKFAAEAIKRNQAAQQQQMVAQAQAQGEAQARVEEEKRNTAAMTNQSKASLMQQRANIDENQNRSNFARETQMRGLEAQLQALQQQQ
jgi:hypothetical protein